MHYRYHVRAAKAQKSLYLPHVCRHFVGPDHGPNCPLKISLSQPLGGGGGGGGGGGHAVALGARKRT